MPLTSEFKNHVLDLLSPLNGVSARSMFGGAGLYLDGVMFGLLSSQDGFYFRTDEENRADYEALGSKPFKPFDDKHMMMPYHEVPVDIMEDPDELCAWARRAWEAARRAAAAKKGTGKKKKKKSATS